MGSSFYFFRSLDKQHARVMMIELVERRLT